MTLAAETCPRGAPAVKEYVACTHCGLPVPSALIEMGAQEQFCCQACRTVYAMIRTCKLDQYYAFRGRDLAAGASSEPAKVTGKAYREFDDPAFLALHAPAIEAGDGEKTRTIEFYLEGVHCASCVWLVEKLPSILPGVIESRLNLGKRLVRVRWIESAGGRASAIARMLDSLGYPPHPARSSNAGEVRLRDDRRQMIRIGVAGACAGNTMLLGTALYAGLFANMDPTYTMLFRWLSMLIGLVALAWPGSTFFRGAWAAIRTRTPHLDLPIALGLGAGGVVGAFNTAMNKGEIYFDSLSVLVFLLLVGRFLQRRQQAVADDAVELLFSLTPMSAHRVTREEVSDVPITALAVEDVVEVRAGESMPVDGVLMDWGAGRTRVDESLLTGESRPRSLEAGAPIHAGTLNISSPVRVKVLATGEATRVGKLMRLVTECARRKAPMVLFADRLGVGFLVAVVLAAAAVFAGWHFWGDASGRSAAVDHAVAILIVACPCALGLATPLAVTVAIGRAARRGILIKGGETLERLARPGVLLLDKTGTLTAGRVSLQYWEGEERLKPAIAAIEAQATHPIARAFCEAFGVPELPAEDIEQEMRGGIRGTFLGRRMVIGSPAFVEESCEGTTACPSLRNSVAQVLRRGLTPVCMAEEGKLCAVAGFGDRLRNDAKRAINQLRAQGWRVGILSGDHPEVVKRVGGELGLEAEAAIGGLLPEEKLEIVQQQLAQECDAGRRRPVVMVGDGVNDAAALAAASVGIAVHGGAEASLAAGSIYLNRPGLMGILEVVTASRKTVHVIWRSLAASLTYNAISVTLAALGLINPLVAAILMPISSLTVLSLAFAARTFTEAPTSVGTQANTMGIYQEGVA